MTNKSSRAQPKKLHTTLGKAVRSSKPGTGAAGGKDHVRNPPLDLSQIRKPIHTSVLGLRQVLSLFETGTDEVRQYVAFECDIMYECRICRNIFRSLANFVLHKREYCREQHRASCLEVDNANICQGAQITCRQAEPTTTAGVVINTTNIGCSPLQSAAISNENIVVEPPPAKRLRDNPGKNKLEPILNRIRSSKNGRNISTPNEEADEVFVLNEQLRLERISSAGGDDENAATTVGVFQSRAGRNSSFKDEFMEIHDILDANEAILDENGKIVVRSTGFKCAHCVASFDTQVMLDQHIDLKHSNKRIVFPCPECGKHLSSVRNVYRHLSRSHGKTIAQVRRLRSKIHSSGKTIYNKDKTDKAISQVASTSKIKLDNLKNQTEVGRINECANCHRTFERKVALQSHRNKCTAAKASTNQSSVPAIDKTQVSCKVIPVIEKCKSTSNSRRKGKPVKAIIRHESGAHFENVVTDTNITAEVVLTTDIANEGSKAECSENNPDADAETAPSTKEVVPYIKEEIDDSVNANNFEPTFDLRCDETLPDLEEEEEAVHIVPCEVPNVKQTSPEKYVTSERVDGEVESESLRVNPRVSNDDLLKVIFGSHVDSFNVNITRHCADSLSGSSSIQDAVTSTTITTIADVDTRATMDCSKNQTDSTSDKERAIVMKLPKCSDPEINNKLAADRPKSERLQKRALSLDKYVKSEAESADKKLVLRLSRVEETSTVNKDDSSQETSSSTDKKKVIMKLVLDKTISSQNQPSSQKHDVSERKGGIVMKLSRSDSTSTFKPIHPTMPEEYADETKPIVLKLSKGCATVNRGERSRSAEPYDDQVKATNAPCTKKSLVLKLTRTNSGDDSTDRPKTTSIVATKLIIRKVDSEYRCDKDIERQDQQQQRKAARKHRPRRTTQQFLELCQPYLDPEDRTRCQPCSSSFRTPEKLLVHMSAHFNWFHYACASCPYKAYKKHRCLRHVQTEHPSHVCGDDNENPSLTGGANLVTRMSQKETMELVTKFRQLSSTSRPARDKQPRIDSDNRRHDQSVSTSTQGLHDDKEEVQVDRLREEEELSMVAVETAEEDEDDEEDEEEECEDVQRMRERIMQVIFGENCTASGSYMNSNQSSSSNSPTSTQSTNVAATVDSFSCCSDVVDADKTSSRIVIRRSNGILAKKRKYHEIDQQY